MGRTAQEAEAECAALGADCLHNVVEREQPPRTVHLSPFYLDVNEVTNHEFSIWLGGLDAAFAEDPNTHEKRWVTTLDGRTRLVDLSGPYAGIHYDPKKGSFEELPGAGNRPVVQITWDSARMYCAAVGKRLPTEAEWEFAARGKTARRYPWGDTPPTCEGTVFARDSEGTACNGKPLGPADVSASPQDWTPEGVHDLFGNVQEWIEDAFLMPYYPDCGPCINPVVELETAIPDEQRVVRGGAWSNSIFGASSARARYHRNGMTTGLGVRCAVTER
jgi:serine/threonine-protein kinase